MTQELPPLEPMLWSGTRRAEPISFSLLGIRTGILKTLLQLTVEGKLKGCDADSVGAGGGTHIAAF